MKQNLHTCKFALVQEEKLNYFYHYSVKPHRNYIFYVLICFSTLHCFIKKLSAYIFETCPTLHASNSKSGNYDGFKDINFNSPKAVLGYSLLLI